MAKFRNLQGIASKAKDVVEKRGGTEALKGDAEQLKRIAKGPGSLSDKAKAAASALKDSGKAEAGGEHPKKAAGRAKTEAAAKTGARADHRDSPEEVGGSK